MKTMSDFIMEQETEFIDNDISVLEGFMKVQAIGAVAECYCEHAAIAAFCESAEIPSVFTESDESLGKRMWGSLKAWFEHIVEWFKAIVKGIISFFTSKKIDRVIEALNRAKREGRVSTLDVGNAAYYIDPEEIFKKIEKFKDIIDKISEAADSSTVKKDVEALSKELEDYIKEGKKSIGKERFDSSATTSKGIDEVISTLETIQGRGPAKSGKELLKKLGYKPKETKTADDKNIEKDANKAIKKLAGQLAKAYDKYCNATVKIVDKALGNAESKAALEELQAQNDARKAEAKGRSDKAFFKPAPAADTTAAEESYAENTDGYYFL